MPNFSKPIRAEKEKTEVVFYKVFFSYMSFVMKGDREMEQAHVEAAERGS